MLKLNKYLFISMLVLMLCCVSAVSASDINGTDDMIITDDIAVDEVSDVIDVVESEESSNDAVEADDSDNVILRGTPSDLPQVNGVPYTVYFNSDGTLKNDVPAYDLRFTGTFNQSGIGFNKFIIDKQHTLNLTDAHFDNVVFEISANSTKLTGGIFTNDGSNGHNSVITVTNASNVEVTHTNMNIVAPNATDFIAIDVNNAENAKLYYNTINYTCGYANPSNFNYVIRAKNSKNIEINYNTIDATVPLKTVNWALSGSIDADYVAGVAIENCTNAKFKYNTLDVIGNIRAGSYPTLDALIIAKSPNAQIEYNTINEKDVVTTENQYSYLYGIDVYSCDNIKINNNTVTMNGNESGGHVGGNGTGAAYCIQLTGGHKNVIVSNNKLTTRNKGPNLGIYSQNVNNATYLKIYGNTIDVSGKAGSDSWSLVSGIEVQDTDAEIYSNSITVNNTAGYHAGYYAFGISYAQSTPGSHYYNIHNNNVTVYNGDYAVYLLENLVTGRVTDNNLIAYTNLGNNTGDDAVSADDENVFIDN